jgi:CubicO group peptidase (beta-lactamase class C family)
VHSGQRRELPPRASLRYLKLEAKRRVADGEFTALHQALLAIAREHGQPSWAALRRLIAEQPWPNCRALTQLRWVISRFSGADDPEWSAPTADEFREHCTARFLAVAPVEELAAGLASKASVWRQEPVVLVAERLHTRVRFGDSDEAKVDVESEPPHRLRGLVLLPLALTVTDPRIASAPTTASGTPPAGMADVVAAVCRDIRFAGLALAGIVSPGSDEPGQEWSTTIGWADLESGEALSDIHRFPAYDVAMLVTAVLVLRLAADGCLRLDDPANRHLRAVRLADETTTVRELLSHTGGVQNLPEALPFGPRAPALATLAGPVLACTGNRGTVDNSYAGYAALGQLVADVTGLSFQRAAARLVLKPLSMTGSGFPARWPSARAVTGYEVEPDGSFRPAPRNVCLLPAAGGLWTTAPDLARFGLGWTTLLPAALAAEALTAQAQLTSIRSIGLGWHLRETTGEAALSGQGPGGAASLLVRRGGDGAHVVLASRPVPLEVINARANLAWKDGLPDTLAGPEQGRPGPAYRRGGGFPATHRLRSRRDRIAAPLHVAVITKPCPADGRLPSIGRTCEAERRQFLRRRPPQLIPAKSSRPDGLATAARNRWALREKDHRDRASRAQGPGGLDEDRPVAAIGDGGSVQAVGPMARPRPQAVASPSARPDYRGHIAVPQRGLPADGKAIQNGCLLRGQRHGGEGMHTGFGSPGLGTGGPWSTWNLTSYHQPLGMPGMPLKQPRRMTFSVLV